MKTNRGIIISYETTRVNSSTKSNENKQYFKSFVYDAVKCLKEGHKTLCFNEEQVREVSKRIPVCVEYDSDNCWWFLERRKI